MESQIPESVARFIAQNIGSLEQLEILLLLASVPEQEWSIEAVYNIVRSSPSSVAERLEELRQRGLLFASETKPTTYRFAPKPMEAAQIVEALAHEYKERRVKVVELVYAPRAEPLKTFADAFKFRKEP